MTGKKTDKKEDPLQELKEARKRVSDGREKLAELRKQLREISSKKEGTS